MLNSNLPKELTNSIYLLFVVLCVISSTIFKIFKISELKYAILISFVIALLTVIALEINAFFKAKSKKHIIGEKKRLKSIFRFIPEIIKADKIIGIFQFSFQFFLEKIAFEKLKKKLLIAFSFITLCMVLIKLFSVKKSKNRIANYLDILKTFLYVFVFLLNSKLIKNILVVKIIAGFLIGAFFCVSIGKIINSTYSLFKNNKKINFIFVSKKIVVEFLFSITKISLISMVLKDEISKSILSIFNPILIGIAGISLFFLIIAIVKESHNIKLEKKNEKLTQRDLKICHMM